MIQTTIGQEGDYSVHVRNRISVNTQAYLWHRVGKMLVSLISSQFNNDNAWTQSNVDQHVVECLAIDIAAP